MRIIRLEIIKIIIIKITISLFKRSEKSIIKNIKSMDLIKITKTNKK